MNTPIPIIDLFAGPGGLGEGFSALEDGGAFKIKLSIEMDQYAHQTLELRAFYRQFERGQAPDEYYSYLRKDPEINRKQLFDRYPDEGQLAKAEAWRVTLGQEPDEIVRDRIKKALDGSEDWVLIGGPPCQAYSVVGRSRMMSKRGEMERDGRSFDSDERHLLYVQYLRVIAEHAPPVFVMENVRGLLSAKLNGQNMFGRIIRDLESPGDVADKYGFDIKHAGLKYQVVPAFANDRQIRIDGGGQDGDPRDYLVKAEDHGVPQARHRLILVGLRKNPRGPILGALTVNSHKHERVSVADAIGDLPSLRSRLSSKDGDDFDRWVEYASSPGESLKNADPVGSLTREITRKIREDARILESESPRQNGAEFTRCELSGNPLQEWYYDSRLNGVCNHTARSHMGTDLGRYFFAAAFASQAGRSPTLRDFPEVLMPDHASAGSRSAFSDRFRVQVAGKPSTTVTSHISKDGHAFIHYDQFQCRSLTVREAARLQTFPDNYFFEGPRTSQYVQVGNAVPPYLARELARVVANLFTKH